MLFLLQKEKSDMDIDEEVLQLKNILRGQKFTNQYSLMSIDDFNSELKLPSNISPKEAIPVGTIDYVQKYLSLIFGINKMSPIEVPEELRLPQFLLRNYSIIDKDELLTKRGYWFVKYAGKLKQFSYTGLIDLILYEDDNKPKNSEPFLKQGLYVFSEVKDILSEYRVIVNRNEIKGIQFYDGDPTIMPTIEEINKIKEMVLRLSINSKNPLAYTLDIAIIRANNDVRRELMIIEMHPFACVGTYGCVGSFLPDAYRNGFDWYVNQNFDLKKFSNF